MSTVYDGNLVTNLGFDVPTAQLIARAGLWAADLPISEVELDRKMHNPDFPNDKRAKLIAALRDAGMLQARV